MNNNILRKCLEELTKENPNIDYVRGMLETLVELNSPAPLPVGKVTTIATPPTALAVPIAEEAMPPTPKSLVKGIAHEAISRG